MRVKICGIKSVQELEFVERYADFTGVVLDSSSRRYVTFEMAREIIEVSSIPVFAVLTSTSFEEVYRIACRIGATYLQIHTENFPLEDFLKLKETGFRLSMAFRVPKFSEKPGLDALRILERIETYRPDLPILDTGRGTGDVHDLRVSREVAEVEEIMLAGGLSPENVRSAVEFVKPWGVDVSGGVERNGGKDESLVRAFVEEVKAGISKKVIG